MSAFRDDFSDLTGPLINDGSECTMTLTEIQNELAALYELAHRGYDIDERRFDYLLKAHAENPEYIAMVEAEKQHWRDSVTDFVQECLERTRTFVPVNIFDSSYDDLCKLGLSPELARRILQRHCLWLTRMSKQEIAKLHEYDLIGRYNSSQQTLDIIETAAVYASLPDHFKNDTMGKKQEWKNGIEDNLRTMLLDNDDDKLPEHRIRNPAYLGLQFGPIKDIKSVRHNEVVSSDQSFLPRRSFTEICKQHSIISKLKPSTPVNGVTDNEDQDESDEQQEQEVSAEEQQEYVQENGEELQEQQGHQGHEYEDNMEEEREYEPVEREETHFTSTREQSNEETIQYEVTEKEAADRRAEYEEEEEVPGVQFLDGDLDDPVKKSESRHSILDQAEEEDFLQVGVSGIDLLGPEDL